MSYRSKEVALIGAPFLAAGGGKYFYEVEIEEVRDGQFLAVGLAGSCLSLGCQLQDPSNAHRVWFLHCEGKKIHG